MYSDLVPDVEKMLIVILSVREFFFKPSPHPSHFSCNTESQALLRNERKFEGYLSLPFILPSLLPINLAPTYLKIEDPEPHLLLLPTINTNSDQLNCSPKILGAGKISLTHIVSCDCAYIYCFRDLGRIALVKNSL